MPVNRLHIRDFISRESVFHFARIELDEIDLAHRHDHDFMEIFWIESGSARHWIGGKGRILDCGSLIFVRPEDFHTVGLAARGTKSLLCNLAFPVARWRELKARYLRKHSGWFAPGGPGQRERLVSPRTLDFLHRAGIEFTTSPRSPLMLDRFILNLAATLQEEAAHSIAGAIPPWLRQAIIRVEREGLFRQGPSALTRAAGRSQEHVVRETRRWLGKKPSELINGMRMQHAAALLSGTQQEILDICADCGIENLGHFYSLFRESHGMTPRQYRLRSQRIVRGAAPNRVR
jgi:AraC family transcriptional regulator, dual regulator of chb operon